MEEPEHVKDYGVWLRLAQIATSWPLLYCQDIGILLIPWYLEYLIHAGAYDIIAHNLANNWTDLQLLKTVLILLTFL